MRIYVSFAAGIREWVQSMASLFASQDIMLVSAQSSVTSATTIDLMIKSDVFLSVVSDTTPHVLFELGYAMNGGVPLVVAVYGDVVLPIDIADFRYVKLTGEPNLDFPPLLRALKDAAGVEARSVEGLSGIELVKFVQEDLFRLEELTPQQFEMLVAALYQQRGYKVEVAGYSRPDPGYDLVVSERDSNNFYLVECKKTSRQSLVSVSTVHQMVDALSGTGAAGGIVISNVPFTAAARALGAQQQVELLRIQDLL